MNESPTLQQLQERPEYQQINSLLHEYKRVIEQKFESNESLLLQELQQKTHQLKRDIALYKTQISQENLQKLITDKRHQKQAQRLQLEVHWRNLTEKYKKLQEQQKKIYQENKQNEFDIQNLERKILQLQQANKNMDQKLHKLKNSADDQPFMTEIKTDYTSPYKYTHKKSGEELSVKTQMKVVMSSAQFRFKLEHKKKTNSNVRPHKKQNHSSSGKLPSFAEDIDGRKAGFLKKNEGKFSQLQINSMYSYQSNAYNCSQPEKFPYGKSEKWAELTYYLNKPEVRDKIFDLFRKESLNL